jgi:hypothetical protein
MNFWSFGTIFVDFSEARDLFVNIFRISDLTAKSRTAGRFRKNRGAPLQNGGEFRPGFIFQRTNPWTGSMPPWTGRARSVHHGPMAARTEGGQGAAACSPELGLRPLRCANAHRRGCNRERSAQGACLGPHRGSGGVEEDGRRR